MNSRQQPNILLIVADAVRAKNTSLHGHINQTTPFLDSFSDEAIVYENAHSPGTWSVPSHTSMFTGYHVAEHGLTTHSIGPHTLEPGHTIWEDLQEDGYATGEFVQGHYITSDELGLASGFDHVLGRADFEYRDLPFDAPDPTDFSVDPESDSSQTVQYLKYALRGGKPIRTLLNGMSYSQPQLYKKLAPSAYHPQVNDVSYQIAESFLNWQSEQNGPWGAFLNLPSAHGPYLPQPEHDLWADERIRRLQIELSNARWDFYSGRTPWWVLRAREALYDGCIRQIDAAIELIISGLRTRNELDDTLVVITADHGEGFGEPSRVRDGFRAVTHRSGVHEVILHVPLIVRPPNNEAREGGIKVTDVATLTNFPDAVKRARMDESVLEAFTPDGPVIASANYNHLVARMESEDAMWSRGFRDEIDFAMFGGRAQIVYENTPDGILKHVKWGDDEATVAIQDAQNSMKMSGSTGRRIDEVFSSINDKGVLKDLKSEVSQQTKQQMEQMGYL